MIPLLETGLKIIDKIIPDAAARDKAKIDLIQLQQAGQLKELEASMNIIVAEANGESELQRNWRPIVMLTFTALIVARWLGFTTEGITPEVEGQLLEIIKIGLGGYVIGRTAEKVVREYKKPV